MLKLPQTIKEQIVSSLLFDDTFEFSLVNKECYYLTFPERNPLTNEGVSAFDALRNDKKQSEAASLYRQLLGKEPEYGDEWISVDYFHEQFRCLEEIAKQIRRRRILCGLNPGKIWLYVPVVCYNDYCQLPFYFPDAVPLALKLTVDSSEDIEQCLDWAREPRYAKVVHALQLEACARMDRLEDLAKLCSRLPNLQIFNVFGSMENYVDDTPTPFCNCQREKPNRKMINVINSGPTKYYLKKILDIRKTLNPEVIDVRIGEGAAEHQFLEAREDFELLHHNELIISEPVHVESYFLGHSCLRHLDISGSGFMDKHTVTALRAVLKDTKLETLCLDLDSGTQESLQEFKHLLQEFKHLLLACPYLKYLKVLFNIVPEDETCVEPLQDISKLLSNIHMVHIGVVHETSSVFRLVALVLASGRGLKHLTFGSYYEGALWDISNPCAESEFDFSDLKVFFKAVKANKSLVSMHIGGRYGWHYGFQSFSYNPDC